MSLEEVVLSQLERERELIIKAVHALLMLPVPQTQEPLASTHKFLNQKLDENENQQILLKGMFK